MSLTLKEQGRILNGEIAAQLESERLSIIADLAHREDEQQKLRHLKARPYIGNSDGLLPSVAAMNAHELRNYSLGRLLKNLSDCEMRSVHGRAKMESSLELELSSAIASDLKQTPPHGGVWVPLTLRPQASLQTTIESAGGFTVGTKLANISDALRQHTQVLRAGASLLSGVNSYSFPVESNVMSGEWLSENGGTDAQASDPSFRLTTPKPHTLIATTTASRQMVGQMNQDTSAWLASRIGLANGLAIDKAALHGSGTEGEPLGVLSVTGIGSVPIGTDGGAPTAASIISLEKSLGDSNADSDSCAFITNSTMRSKLRTIVEVTGGALPLWRDGSMLGYRALCSNQVKSDLVKGNSSDCSAVIFANWQHLVLCEFSGALEILANPFTLVKQGMVIFTSYAVLDVALLQPSALAVIPDARNV
jgi:HK97 family phage major capsid protein